MFSLLYDIQRCQAVLEKLEADGYQAPTRNPMRARPHPKYLAGPAAKALIELSRKHFFVRLDLGNLYKSHRSDHHLPKRVKSIMKKITNADMRHPDEIKQKMQQEKKEEEAKVEVEVATEIKETQSKYVASNINTMSSMASLAPNSPTDVLEESRASFDITKKFKHLDSKQVRKKRRSFGGGGTAVERSRSRVNNIRYAKHHHTWKNKMWLILENHHSSPIAEKIYFVRLLIYLFASFQIMLSTWPEYNAYGQTSRHCKRLVVTYCNLVQDTPSTKKDQWLKANPACWANATTGYAGCLDEATCAFPSIAHNMTCEKGKRRRRRETMLNVECLVLY
mgnify:CR=1 FL=1